ncbi:MAG: hypothetical protein LBG13_02070 [Holosporales bacterium]|jgi:hypothetical protein|nr:hypothetical protein [Holosporales bacterium]
MALPSYERNRPRRVQLQGIVDAGYERLWDLERERADGNLQVPHLMVRIGDGGAFTEKNTLLNDGTTKFDEDTGFKGNGSSGENLFAIHVKIGGAIYSDASGFTLHSAEKYVVEAAPILLIIENHFNVMKITNAMFAGDIDFLTILEVKYTKKIDKGPATLPQITRVSEFETVRIMFSDYHSSKYFYMFAFNADKSTETYKSYGRDGELVGNSSTVFDYGYGVFNFT